MLFRRGGERPELGQIKELKCSAGALAAIVERQGRKGWHIADGRHGTDDLRDKFRKSHIAAAVEVGDSGGAKTVTPSGSLSVQNKTATASVSVNSTAAGGSISVANKAAGGSISVANKAAGGSISVANKTAGGSVSVNNHTLTEAQMPAHLHDVHANFIGSGTGSNGGYLSANATYPTAPSDATGGGGAHNHGATFTGTAHNHTATFTGSDHNHTASFTGTAHNHTATFSGSGHVHTGGVTVDAHNHSATFTGSSQSNEPQHIIVLVLQYTGQKIQGVVP